MGYRPSEQSVENPLRKILEGMKEFDKAVQERMESGEWKEEHLDEIESLNQELSKLRRVMIRLANDNW